MSSDRRGPDRRTVALVTLQVVVVLVLVIHVFGIGGGLGIEGQWYVPREWAPVAGPWRLTAGLQAGLVIVAIALLSSRLEEAVARPAVRAALVTGAIGAALVLSSAALRAADPLPPVLRINRIASIHVDGYFDVAWRADSTGELLRDFEGIAAVQPTHVATHPPGSVLLYRAAVLAARHLDSGGAGTRSLLAGLPPEVGDAGAVLEPANRRNRAFGARDLDGQAAFPAWLCGWLLAALGALTILPVYLLGTALGGPRVGLLAALLQAVVPAAAIFSQSLDPLLGTLAVASTALFLARPPDPAGAARRGGLLLASLSGLLVGIATFISWGAVPLVVLPPLAWLALRGVDRPLLHRALTFTVGGAAVWLAAMSLGSAPPWRLFALGMGAHMDVTVPSLGRPWLLWLGLNWVEFGIGLGPALAVVALVGLITTWRRTGWAGLPPLARLFAAALAVQVAVDLTGAVRGEVSRIWIWFMPFWILAAARWLQDGPHPGRRAALLISLEGLTFVTLAFGLALFLI